MAGPQQFAKIGTRNAMVIAVTSFGLALHGDRRTVGAAIGSAAPTPRHAPDGGGLPGRGAGRGRAVGVAGRPARRRRPGSATWSRRPRRRSTTCAARAAYRRHALAVLARRTLGWAWTTTGRRRDAGDLTVNGERRQADDVWEGESLLYVLRERLGLPGSKNACEQGECGSCSVYLDGALVCACLVAAGQAQGRDV